MRISRYIFFLFVFLLTSCAMEEAFEPEEVPEVETELPDSVFFILADPAPLTRVTYAGDGLHADFEKEDLVGCFALNDDLTAAEGDGFKPNACYRVSVHTNIKDGKDRRFLSPVTDSDDLDKSKTKYLFYYPYDPEITSLDQLKKYTHSVNTDQNDRDRYEASDLLWDICTPIAELKSVEVEMDHAMAQIIVEVESGLIKEGTVPTLLDIPTTVSKLDLVKLNLDAMTSGLHEAGAYELSTAVDNVVMWEFGYATSGNLMFRAAVPANHTISSGSKILSLENPEGNKVTYRLSKGLSFEPGKTYLMTLVSRKDVVAPEITDKDSWVLDVLDPRTMEPVGLLCQEYLRFQPGLASNTSPEHITGDEYDSGRSKYISSLAWVFYKLDNGVPDLDEGQVLRFVYDVRSHIDITYEKPDKQWLTHPYWPAPHVKKGGLGLGGFFTPEHGHDWVCQVGGTHGESAKDGVMYEGYSEEYQHRENYMHGGQVIWDGQNNVIKDFVLPTLQITNQVAKENGHIAISKDTGKPIVSYSPLGANDSSVDSDGNIVCQLVQHNLVDRRIGKAKSAEERMYPLVKIGYNQFWMSYSLRATTLTNGTPIDNYNDPETVGGVTFGSILDKPGFLYTSKICDNGANSYNPYFTMTPVEREKHEISVLYNSIVISSGQLVPNSYYDNSQYYMPTKADAKDMLEYLGWYAGAKIMTRRVRTWDNGSWAAGTSEYNSLLNGEYSRDVYNAYTANICGFDLRADGGYQNNEARFNGAGQEAAIWLLGDGSIGNATPYLMSFHDYNVFAPNVIQSIQNLFWTPYPASQTFYPVRFFMKFDGQADTGGGVSVSSVAKGLATKSSSAPVEKRDVYVGLEPVEEE